MVKLAPSLLAADFSNLKLELEKVKKADYLHLDIMDGLFVPNISFGPGMVKALRPHSKLKFDTHLMIEHPERYIEEFVEAGSEIITLHLESTRHIHRAVQQVKANNCQVGVALNPATSLQELEFILSELDLVLIMSVNPGFGGQSFIPQTLAKISKLRKMIDEQGLDLMIEVDGGVNMANCKEIFAAGADILVAGSAIFKQPDPAAVVEEFKDLCMTR